MRFLPGLSTACLLLVALCPAAGGPPKDKDPPKHTNRLAKEQSPYLLMHAHNPVDWYPWGQEAFDKAKKENKLVFLSIGYSSTGATSWSASRSPTPTWRRSSTTTSSASRWTAR